MLEIEFWSDLYCPFAYIASIRLRRAIKDFDAPVRVHWRCWPLELVNQAPTPRADIEMERAALASAEPQAFNMWKRDDYPYTMLPAMAALKCAALQGPEAEDRYNAALRDGFFRDGYNLSLLHELLDLASKSGIDRERLERDWWQGVGHAALWRDWQDSQNRPIQGSPHLFVVGADMNVHSPGFETRQNPFGIHIIDHDDPHFLHGWLKQAQAAVQSTP